MEVIPSNTAEQIQHIEKLLLEFLNRRDTTEVVNLIQNKVKFAEEQKKNAVWKNFKSQNKIEENLEQKNAEYKKILRNLLNSETEYLNNLQEIVKKYLFPIRTGAIKMKTQTFLAIFSNIDILYGIHQEIHTDLKELESQFPNITFASVFRKHVDSMQIYTQYVNNFSNSLYALEIERKRSKPFNQFLAQSEATGMSLEILLPMPLNRIPQYRSFIKMLMDLTSETDPDYVEMNFIVDQMTELQETVNVSITQSKNMGDIIDVEKRVIGRDNVSLRDIHRRFVREGQVSIIDKEKKHKDSYIFLFNDILVITSIQAKNIYKYKSIFLVQYCKILQDGYVIILTSTENKESISIKPNPEDREAWLRDISKVINDLDSTQVFEKPLDLLMKRETDSSKTIPTVIEDLIKRIEDSAIETPGIFRISGSKVTTNQIKNQINRGIPIELSFLDDHVIASLVKQFFRSLPDSLIPATHYQRLVECGRQENPIPMLKQLIESVPPPNYNLLKRLFGLLKKISLKSDVNMMSASNLAIVIGPNLAREKVLDGDDELSPLAEIAFSSNCGPIIEMMILQYATLFPEKIQFAVKPNSSSSHRDGRGRLNQSGRTASSKFDKRTSLIGDVRNMVNQQQQEASHKFQIGNRRLNSNESSDQLTTSEISAESPNTPESQPDTEQPSSSPQIENENPSPLSPSVVSEVTRSPSPMGLVKPPMKPAPPPRKKTLPGTSSSGNIIPLSSSSSEVTTPPESPISSPSPSLSSSSDSVLSANDANNNNNNNSNNNVTITVSGAMIKGSRRVRKDNNNCANCGGAMTGSGLKVMGKNWHLECFVCRECRRPFDGGSFREYNGLPYCEKDFETLLKHAKCAGCTTPIGDDYIEVMAMFWHPACLICSSCNGSLSDGFIMRNRKPLCQTCKKAQGQLSNSTT